MPCGYNRSWESDPKFRAWIRRTPSQDRAYCSVCRKSFDVSNMGVGAVKSHARGDKHAELLKQQLKNTLSTPPMDAYLQKSVTDTSLVSDSESSELHETTEVPAKVCLPSTSEPADVDTSNLSRLTKFIVKQEALKAEIYWAMETIMTHQSFSSNKRKPELFVKMFPDSDIAKQFSMRETKCKYLTQFGIAPYIERKVTEMIKKSDYYVASFDETLNELSQAKQMDLLIRYWDDVAGRVATRYMGSQFMGHGTANDLCEHFEKGLHTIGLNNLLQVSMDGPSVNWSFHSKLCERREEEHMTKLLEIGSCSLHVVHGSLQTAVSTAGWDIAPFLRAMYNFFHDSPARRADFTRLTGCTTYPLKFCATRWVEDIAVTKRAIELLPHVSSFVTEILRKPPSQVPKTITFEALRKGCGDNLMLCKLRFFAFGAGQLVPYLKMFQSAAPMVPFLVPELSDLLTGIMERCLKPEVVRACDSSTKLAKIDTKNKDNHLPLKKVDLGFDTKNALSQALSEKSVTEKQALEFRSDCRDFFLAILRKLLDRCPMSYPLARAAAALNPNHITQDSDECVRLFSRLLEILQSAGIKAPSECDTTLKQYRSFIAEMNLQNKADFKLYKYSNTRLDEFLMKFIKEDQLELKSVFVIVLTLSHGQADIERSFSINGEMERENLKNETLVSMKMTYDEVVCTSGCVVEYDITPELIASCKGARMKYEQYHEDEKKKALCQKKSQKRKTLSDEVKECERKKVKLSDTIQRLNEEATALALQAEKKERFPSLNKVKCIQVENRREEERAVKPR